MAKPDRRRTISEPSLPRQQRWPRRWLLLRRPSLHPVYTPAGLPVTEQGAHNYPHHKGVFLALGKIDDTNVYVDTTHNSEAWSWYQEGYFQESILQGPSCGVSLPN